MTDLTRWRDEFPILSQTIYMISNSLGAMPRRTADDLAEYARTWATRGVRAWEERWWEMPLEVGGRIARIIGAPAGSVSMHENVTTAHMIALSSLQPSGSKRRIVCTEMDFPSMLYLYRAQQTRGFELAMVPAEDDLSIRAERLLDAIDDATAVVACSHVLFRTSAILDAAAIIRRAHAVGAPVILDAYQSAGVVPLDVTALGVDFAVGGCLKWLCGGPGNAFLFTRPDLLKTIRPSFTGWQAHETPFGFESEMRYADDAWRWLNGTPAIPALYAAIEGPRIVRRAGVDRIREKSIRQTSRLIALADERGYKVTAPRDSSRRGGTVAFDVPHSYGVAQALLAEHVIVDYRPNAGIRVAPHFYTSDDELERAVAMIDDIVRTEAWQPFEARRGVVT